MSKKHGIHVALAILVASAGIIGLITLAIRVGFTLGMSFQSDAHLAYVVKKPVSCDDEKCNIVLQMTNHDRQPYHLDYYGTDGPGPAERGTWWAYYIGKDRQKCDASSNISGADIDLPPGKSINFALTCWRTFANTNEIDHIEVFGTKIYNLQ